VNLFVIGAAASMLFLGGWNIPMVTDMGMLEQHWWWDALGFAIFIVKDIAIIFVIIWIRWTLPRFRYDQLMALGWKFMLPTALAYIVVIATGTLVLQSIGIYPDSWKFSLAMLGVNIVLMTIIVGVIDRGRLISPAYSRLDKRNLAKLRNVRYERARLEPVTTEGGAD
jgi:NADH-quinone oxidoreductase subunit H